MPNSKGYVPGVMANAYAAREDGEIGAGKREMIARRERLLGPAYRLFYGKPLHFVRGEGVWLYDPEGNAYLDVYNNVASVGHCHPHVVAALTRQATMLNTHTRYLHETILEYAERLLGYGPAELGHVMFTCTGSEANDLALRIAKVFTGGAGFVVTNLAYHGVTDAVSQLSPSLGRFVEGTPHVRTVPPPDGYRSPGADVGAEFGRQVEVAIADLQEHGIKPAALIVDTIFSSDGVFAEPCDLLAPAAKAIRRAGGVFIADEVQSGFGRTGEAMWGFQRHRVVPDIVTVGKPMGNGHPIAAVMAKPDVVREFGARSRYFNTFGGNPVSCAVGMAVLDVIEGEDLIENALMVGAHMRIGLNELARRHQIIGDVRGAGLFIGLEFVRDRTTREPATAATGQFVNQMRERHVLTSATGPLGNVLKIRPPLVFSKANADQFIDTTDAVLTDMERTGQISIT
jgi:4-aminobutyrate aminotransferase-like enzyme